MRARTSSIVVIGLAVVLGACGSSTKTGQTTTPTSTTSATTTTLSTPQLRAKMLDGSDVGAFWKVGNPVNPMDLSGFAQIPCPNITVDPAVAKRLTGDTGVQFEPTDGSYKHMIEMALTGEPGQLDSDLQQFIDAMNACAASLASASTTSGTQTLSGTKLPIPALGDQRGAWVGYATESPGSQARWYIRNAVVRVGSTAIGLGLTEILFTPKDTPKFSNAEFVQILETAVNKIGG